MKEKTEFTPGPYNAVIEDHSSGDTGEWYTTFCIEAENEGKKRTFAQSGRSWQKREGKRGNERIPFDFEDDCKSRAEA